MNLKRALYTLLVFVPVAFGLGLAHASPTAIFFASCLAILPLAGLMGEATEHGLASGASGLVPWAPAGAGTKPCRFGPGRDRSTASS